MFTLVFVILLGVVAYKTVFVPVSVDMTSYPGKIFVNSSAPVDIKVFALNRIGFRIPFMHLRGKFLIPEGADKIQVMKTESDQIILRPLGTSGKLVVLYYTPAVAFPVEIVLHIESSSMAFLHLSVLALG